MNIRNVIKEELFATDGLLRLTPALVARDWLPSGRRLGLATSDEYDVGERGEICERWLGSTTKADNRVGPEDEGLSYVVLKGGARLCLRDIETVALDLLMGDDYASDHETLGRLAKIFDYGARIPFHIHPPQRSAAKVGVNSKDEAYYFPPGRDMGPNPETFLGLHPDYDEEYGHRVLKEDIERWADDLILRHSRAYLQVEGEGFFVHSGMLHAPGTALTIELQEESDAMSLLQAKSADHFINKDLLYTHISESERDQCGVDAVLDWIDWDANTDPNLYSNRNLKPLLRNRFSDHSYESWIFYGSTKFVGTKLVVGAGESVSSNDECGYNILVWQGEGTVGSLRVMAGNHHQDELFVTHQAAGALPITNTGNSPLMLIKFFGPDIYPAIEIN